MTIITDTYRNATLTPRRTHTDAPGATKHEREISTAIRPLSNRWIDSEGSLPPIRTNVELKGARL